MIIPDDKSCSLYVRIPLKKEGKYKDVEHLKHMIAEKFQAKSNGSGDIYTDDVEYEIRKNTGYDETSETNGDFARFYFIVDIDPNPTAQWTEIFNSVCNFIVYIRSLGGNAVPLCCDYEQEITDKIGEDEVVKFT